MYLRVYRSERGGYGWGMKATHLILAAVLVMAAFFSGFGADDIKHKCAECKNMVNMGATRCEHCGGNPYKGQHKGQAGFDEAFNQALENQRDWKLESSGGLGRKL